MLGPVDRSMSEFASIRSYRILRNCLIIQHANDAVEEVRRAEFFRKGPKMRDIIKEKRWLLLSRWKNLALKQRGVLNRLFQLNRRVFKAYLLKESLEQDRKSVV